MKARRLMPIQNLIDMNGEKIDERNVMPSPWKMLP
jgi:hypothetical protein